MDFLEKFNLQAFSKLLMIKEKIENKEYPLAHWTSAALGEFSEFLEELLLISGNITSATVEFGDVWYYMARLANNAGWELTCPPLEPDYVKSTDRGLADSTSMIRYIICMGRIANQIKKLATGKIDKLPPESETDFRSACEALYRYGALHNISLSLAIKFGVQKVIERNPDLAPELQEFVNSYFED